MCGIAGILEHRGDVEADRGLVARMCKVMTHRGPDDQGLYAEGRIAVGMRRLSIVDLAGGHQPITNEDGSVWIVFNGEIYNHGELREELIRRGHRYRTRSDTETIVHLYEEYGKESVNHLRGMFAFAVWDSKQKRLFIARDRLGIKPLYYTSTGDRFLFGSEIKVLLEHPDVRPEFNRAALPEYLAFGYLSGSDTMYQGIRKLMPGHWLEISEGGELKIEQYWDLETATDKPAQDENYYVNSYRELLEGAVRSHLMSDVPLGVFLSGGVDSSAVAALATRIRREPVETFSVGYAEQDYSELPYARMVAGHLHSRHHEVLISSHDFFTALPRLIWHEDEPMVWPSSVSLYFVAQLARERVKVVLTGEGSDETLAGYTRYAWTLKNRAFDRLYRGIVPRSMRAGIRHFISGSPWIQASARRKLSHSFLGADGDVWAEFYFDNFFSAFSARQQSDLLAEETARQLETGAAYRHVLQYWERSSGELLGRLLYTDIKTYLVELLMKQDNMSMAASIESRVPFLDHVLVEWAMRVPAQIQIHGLAGKRILKKAMQGLLPDTILYRPKLGFPTPWSGWLRGPEMDRVERTLLEPRSVERRLFRRTAVERLFREHRAGYRDHYDRIWRLLNLELWMRVCLEDESPLAMSAEPQARLTTVG